MTLSPPRLSLDDAIQRMRASPEHAATVRDAYLGADVEDSARRFATSGEFAAVLSLLGEKVQGCTLLDVGAGTGIASLAFVNRGAGEAIAIEPDPSELVGRGAAARLCAGKPIRILADDAEHLSLPSGSVDIVYARQVLHHLRDLDGALREFARVLRPGGIFLACREHVADDARQLAQFLAAHPMHQLAGGENAFSLSRYREAVIGAGLRLEREFGPWDSVINAFPFVHSDAELAGYTKRWLDERFGMAGRLIAHLPAIDALVWRHLRRARPGRMYTFFARKAA